ncbi:glycine oxidase ThiO [Pseudomonas flexibilis]|uniref:D-amino acid oxidase n=1 Tax=Pseudomonas flexibilis TaxID=706570 RepID=A0A0B3BPP3_9PSED|nr:glycine oxidase ThiO [Pseudomonas flexibilis]KHO64585.1 D-amino acid oxidase [Pseudomonas flexibilis]SCY01948.1 glycine oxidase [Pseudomonas flexibilis]
MQHVLVIGAGIIGLLTAYKLVGAGLRVTLVEGGEPGREASWAGGGIVSPLYPWRYPAAVQALALQAQDAYPALTAQLLQDSGVDPELHVTGLYWMDVEDEEQALAWAARFERTLERVPVDDVRRTIPALADRFQRALYMPGVANIRNPRLLKALRVALERLAHVEIHSQQPVQGFVQEGGRVVGVRTAAREYRADQVVLAAGAWSGELLATLGVQLPVQPVRGQMILFKCATDFLPSMVLAGRRYAIPRRDGHILVGSTLEYCGFDKSTTENALDSLRATAAELLPDLANAPVVGHWAGLRPGSPDGIPFIGELASHPGLWLNCGHFRNGLVLAPASCRLLADLMLGRAPSIDPTPYAPDQRLG